MQRLYEYLRGTARIEISGESPERLLNVCAMRGLEFWDCDPGDGYSMRITVYAEDAKTIKKLSQRAMCSACTLSSRGGEKIVKNALRRRWLVLAVCIFAVLLAWSSLYLWDIEVTGNKTVPTGDI